MSDLSAKQLKEYRSLVYRECSCFCFQGCLYHVCDMQPATKKCCYLCDREECEHFRMCAFFERNVLPAELRRADYVRRDKEAIKRYKETAEKKRTDDIRKRREAEEADQRKREEWKE